MRTLLYTISLVFCFVFVEGFSQQKAVAKVKKDSLVYKSNYGFRVGADISRPILSAIEKEYSGFEIMGDYRISNRWYLATELGAEEQTTIEDYTNSTASGSYIRLGANTNFYNNWLDMSNEIYFGGRYGFALFNQTLNSYTPNVNSLYFPAKKIISPIISEGLMAHWLEFQLGIKVETLKNLFVGFNTSYKIGISIQNPKNFKTLYAPGFNRVFSNGTGFGFSYHITYLIPFFRK